MTKARASFAEADADADDDEGIYNEAVAEDKSFG